MTDSESHGLATGSSASVRLPIAAVAVLTLLFTPLVALGEAPLQILAFGDSLTAGFGLRAKESFPVRLEAALSKAGVDAEVVNAGVSGDTTSGGRARLDWALSKDTDVVILELGANDGLRGIAPSLTKDNLSHILGALHDRGLRVLLAGMYAPPNFGSAYTEEFNAIYPALAERFDNVLLYPFFLDGVATIPELNQRDGVHPNTAGVEVIIERIVPYVLRLLKRPP